MEIIDLSKTSDLEASKRATEVLRRGGLIVYPTETCYGLGVMITNKMAVEKLWKFKGERGDKPVLVAINTMLMAKKYAEINNIFKAVARKYWPGPVSMVTKSRKNIPEKIRGGKPFIGLRMPDQSLILKIVKSLKVPVTSTSANISGGKNPYSLEQFQNETPKDRIELVDLFIDAGHIPERLPSTLIDTTEGTVKVLRQGEVVVKI